MSPTPICDPDEATSAEYDHIRRLLELTCATDATGHLRHTDADAYDVSTESVRARDERRRAMLSAGFALDKAITHARSRYEAVDVRDLANVVSEMRAIRGLLR